jgi:nucleoside-diphosphate-sugar epimerase
VGVALVIGAGGQIGRAAALALARDGWEVVAASRSGSLADGLAEAGVRAVRVDRADDRQLRAALGNGADVVIDVIPFTPGEAEQLLALDGLAGSLVAISTASVYADDEGRALDEATSADTFPLVPVPIAETQRTVPAGDETYSTRKVAVEETLLRGPMPATVIRPCAVHGPGSKAPRELFFVRRILDGRRKAILVSSGESRFHTTSVDNLAELIRLAALKPGKRVLNCGDPEPPTTHEIGEAISRAMNAELELVPIPESGYERQELGNPWAVPRPFLLDMDAAEQELGYRAVTTYAEAVPATCAWLRAELGQRDFSDTYLASCFNYEAEDAELSRLRRLLLPAPHPP